MSDIAKGGRSRRRKDQFHRSLLAVIIGVFVFALALFSLSGADLIGWAVTTSVYADIANALARVAKAPPGLGGGAARLLTRRASGAAGSFALNHSIPLKL